MITPYNILRHELIGLEAKIVDSTHPGYMCSGTITRETRNTLEIQGQDKKARTLPKDCITLELKLPAGEIVKLDGKLIVARPEDRVKKKYRIKFA